jgi:hypothetical protein
MSALGQKRTSRRLRVMSAIPPKADIETQSRDIRFVRACSLFEGLGAPAQSVTGANI